MEVCKPLLSRRCRAIVELHQDWAVASADTDGFARENTDSEAERNLQGEDTQDDMVKFKCPPCQDENTHTQ